MKVTCTDIEDIKWKSEKADLKSLKKEVHVYFGNAGDFLAEEDYFNSVLNEEEIEKAKKFYYEEDRQLFIISHGMLREVLASYVENTAANIQFGKDSFYKPYLLNPTVDIRFNLSHSHDKFFIGISSGCDIGVDVEQVREFDYRSVAQTVFSEKEQDLLFATDYSMSMLKFFKLWTRKEAFLKFTGKGLITSLKEIELSEKENEINADLPINETVRIISAFLGNDYLGVASLKNKISFFKL